MLVSTQINKIKKVSSESDRKYFGPYKINNLIKEEKHHLQWLKNK